MFKREAPTDCCAHAVAQRETTKQETTAQAPRRPGLPT
jgi:hypothetical protein